MVRPTLYVDATIQTQPNSATKLVVCLWLDVHVFTPGNPATGLATVHTAALAHTSPSRPSMQSTSLSRSSMSTSATPSLSAPPAGSSTSTCDQRTRAPADEMKKDAYWRIAPRGLDDEEVRDIAEGNEGSSTSTAAAAGPHQ